MDRTIVVWLGIALALVGCGDDGPSAPPRDGGAMQPSDAGATNDVEQFLGAIAAEACESAHVCLGTEVSFEQQLGNETRCRAHVEASIVYVASAVGAGRARFEGARVDACLAAIDAAVCERSMPLAWEEWPAECRAVIAGTVAPGAACETSVECAGGACVCGECVALVARGGACEDGPCAPGLQCASESLTCEPVPDVLQRGDACEDFYACSGLLRCVDGVCRDGRERRTQALGAPCDAENLLCGLGLECDFDHGSVCVGPLEAGAACDDVLEISLCPEGTICHGIAGEARCSPPLAMGEECISAGRADPCGVGLWCSYMTGRCEEVRALGARCELAEDCHSGICEEHVCVLGESVACR
ncbi:hypothetical protein [Sandaracinus amylolyticus]|uniref:hypothetical protein n=1 Tax=Sandaracinus amylolyticus TaxID=927083 RepID=UPI001F3470E3|nr:hypothetical protein [Sandaracinus amylolyticus]UJR86610.1 Hypothetical protein I5071_87110 [Sandaracinus amylolyticus]